MKKYLRSKSFWAYMFIGLSIGAIVLMLVWTVLNTRQIVSNTDGSVDRIQVSLGVLRANIEADHDTQDNDMARVLQCLSNLFIQASTATQAEVDECTNSASNEGIEPVSPIGNQSSQNIVPVPSSSSNDTPVAEQPQPNNSQPENDLSQPDLVERIIMRMMNFIGDMF